MNLAPLFNPKSIAVVGASRNPHSIGHDLVKNLISGGVCFSNFCKPFPGKIFLINPSADEILGLKCYSSILDIKEKIDLVIIVVPAKVVLNVVHDCIKIKAKSVIIISAGFSEYNAEGKKIQEEIVSLLQEAKIPMVGPNCLGIIVPQNNLNASFAPTMPSLGKIAFLSQSGALVDSIIDWSVNNNYGFSAVVGYGNQAMLNVCDFLEYFNSDSQTEVITLYLESITNGKRFMDIAKKINKPILALKSGRTEHGIKAISSHTGNLASSYEIYKSAFKQSNIIIVDTVEELFDNAKALANMPKLTGDLAIVTNGGGCGVLCADYCHEFHLPLAEIEENTLLKLDSSGKMHSAYSRRNPLDLVGDALPERYEVAINTLLAEKKISGLIVIQTLQSNTNSKEDAQVIINAHKKYPHKPIICVFMGGKFTQESVNLLESSGIPNYGDLRKAALAMSCLFRK